MTEWSWCEQKPGAFHQLSFTQGLPNTGSKATTEWHRTKAPYCEIAKRKWRLTRSKRYSVCWGGRGGGGTNIVALVSVFLLSLLNLLLIWTLFGRFSAVWTSKGKFNLLCDWSTSILFWFQNYISHWNQSYVFSFSILLILSGSSVSWTELSWLSLRAQGYHFSRSFVFSCFIYFYFSISFSFALHLAVSMTPLSWIHQRPWDHTLSHEPPSCVGVDTTVQ